ncbi:hypothetical protein ACOMHN_056848 [Nucella lapillus]
MPPPTHSVSSGWPISNRSKRIEPLTPCPTEPQPPSPYCNSHPSSYIPFPPPSRVSYGQRIETRSFLNF